MRSRTPQRSSQERVYLQLNRIYLERHPDCESPWPCGNRATTIQHRAGRRGYRLLDMEWWAASCWACNVDAESDGAIARQARELGWKVSPDCPDAPADVPIRRAS